MIRARLHDELGERITASIGIAPNKLMAKLASGHMKPNGLTVARPQDVLALLDECDLEDICALVHASTTVSSLWESPTSNSSASFPR